MILSLYFVNVNDVIIINFFMGNIVWAAFGFTSNVESSDDDN